MSSHGVGSNVDDSRVRTVLAPSMNDVADTASCNDVWHDARIVGVECMGTGICLESLGAVTCRGGTNPCTTTVKTRRTTNNAAIRKPSCRDVVLGPCRRLIGDFFLVSDKNQDEFSFACTVVWVSSID